MFVRILVSICFLVGRNAQSSAQNTTDIPSATAPTSVLSTSQANEIPSPPAGANTTRAPANESAIRFLLTFALLNTFNNMLYNHSSTEFQFLEHQVVTVLKAIFFTIYPDFYKSTKIKRFSPGSIVVEAELEFVSGPLISANAVKSALASAASGTNFPLLVNVSSISVRDKSFTLYADLRLSSLMQVNRTMLDFIAEQVSHLLIGYGVSLNVGVKEFFSCNEGQCGEQQGRAETFGGA